MGPHEEYSAKLEKLRRSQPMPTGQQTVQGGSGNRQQGGGEGGGQSVRSQRPSRPQESRSGVDDSVPAPSGRSLAAPRAGGQQQAHRSGAAPDRSARPSRQVDDEDDFGDTDVASLLD